MRVYRKNGFVRIYGREFNGGNWYDIPDDWLGKVDNSEWIIEGQAEPTEEVLEEPEAQVDDGNSTPALSSLKKKELQALCEERGIEFVSADSKNILLTLLQPADEEE